MLRIGIPLRCSENSLEGGISLVVAAAKLSVFESHEAAASAKLECMSYNPRVDEIESIVESYMLVQDCMKFPRNTFLAAEMYLSHFQLRSIKRSIGRFSEDLRILSIHPRPLYRVYDIGTEMERLAYESGFELPPDWQGRMYSLLAKHLPEAVN